MKENLTESDQEILRKMTKVSLWNYYNTLDNGCK